MVQGTEHLLQRAQAKRDATEEVGVTRSMKLHQKHGEGIQSAIFTAFSTQKTINLVAEGRREDWKFKQVQKQFDKIHGKDDSKIVLNDKIHGKDASKIVLHTKARAVAQGDAPGGAGGWLEIRVGVALPAAPCARRCCTRLWPDPARLLSPKITPGLYINKRLEEA